MKKNLAKRIVLGLLTGAVLMSSSIAWAEDYAVYHTGGKGSFGVGYNTDSSDNDETLNPGGVESTATNSIVIGSNSVISGSSSIGLGLAVEVTADHSVAIGSNASVTGTNGVALGAGAKVEGVLGVALGKGSIAKGYVVSVGRADSNANDSTDDGLYRKIVNVEDGEIDTGSHEAVTGGQLYDNYGGGAATLKTNGSSLILGKNLTDAVRNLDTQVNANITAITGKADKATTLSGYGITDAYTKAEANNTFLTQANADQRYVQINDNTISNNGEITFDVGNKTNVVTISTTGLTVGDTSTHIDGKGVYVGAHDFTTAKSAMNDKGEIKGAGGKFEVGTDGQLKAANGKFEVDDKGNVTAESVTAGNLYTKDEIDQKLGGSNASISGINQRLEKTNAKINKVGAGAAALAALHPLDYDPDDKLTFSAGMGNYAGENAAALGAFYRPNEKFMLSLGGTMGNGENMVNLGLSIGLDKANGFAKMSKRELIQEVNAVKAENEAMKDQLANADERIAKLEALVAQLVAK